MITPPLAQAASELLARRAYDVAYVTGPSMASVVPALGDVPAILGALDAWHLNVAAEARVAPSVMRPLYRLEALHVRRFGARFYPAYRAVVAVTAEDADAIRAIAPGVETAVVPNGVDIEHVPAGSREAFLGYFQTVHAALMAGRGERGRTRLRITGAIGHAINFHTWHSLVREQQLSADEAITLMTATVHAATQPTAGPPRQTRNSTPSSRS